MKNIINSLHENIIYSEELDFHVRIRKESYTTGTYTFLYLFTHFPENEDCYGYSISINDNIIINVQTFTNDDENRGWLIEYNHYEDIYVCSYHTAIMEIMAIFELDINWSALVVEL